MKLYNLSLLLLLVSHGISYAQTSTTAHKRVSNPFPRWVSPDNRLRYDQACFLVSHNSYSNNKEGYPSNYQQSLSTIEQLDYGVRGLMQDTYDYKGNIYLCHGQCQDAPKNVQQVLLRTSLLDTKRWLDRNPTEIVTIILENYAPTKKIKDIIYSIPNLGAMLLTLDDWNPADHDGYWPTLQWLQEHNKRLIVFDSQDTEKTTGIYYQWYYMTENQYSTTDIDKACRQRDESMNAVTKAQQRRDIAQMQLQLKQTTAQRSQQKRYQDSASQAADQLKAETTFVNTVSHRHMYLLNLFSSPTQSNSSLINSLPNLEKLITTCKAKHVSGLNPNFIALDLVQQGDALRLINKLNAQAAQKLP